MKTIAELSKPLSELSVEELVRSIGMSAKSISAAYHQMGKAMFWLSRRLSVELDSRDGRLKISNSLAQEFGTMITGTICKHAGVAARAYARVGTSLTEEEYEALSLDKMRDLVCSIEVRPARSRIALPMNRAVRVVHDEPEPLVIEDLDEDIKGDLARMSRHLSEAQNALLAARDCLTSEHPGQWDAHITNSLRAIGALRFDLGEKLASAKIRR